MVAVPGPPPLPKLDWQGRLDCRARQFAEAGGDEFKAGHDRELLLRRTIRDDKVGGKNIRPERAFFRPRVEVLGKDATRDDGRFAQRGAAGGPRSRRPFKSHDMPLFSASALMEVTSDLNVLLDVAQNRLPLSCARGRSPLTHPVKRIRSHHAYAA